MLYILAVYRYLFQITAFGKHTIGNSFNTIFYCNIFNSFNSSICVITVLHIAMNGDTVYVGICKSFQSYIGYAFWQLYFL